MDKEDVVHMYDGILLLLLLLSCFSCVQLCATLWTIARQAPLSVGFSRQKYQSGLQCPSPGDLRTLCLFRLLHWQVGSLPLAPPRKSRYLLEKWYR